MDITTAAPATPTSNLTITDLTASAVNTNATIQVGLSKNAVPFVSGGGSGIVPGVTTAPTVGDSVNGWIVQDATWGGQAALPPGSPDITLTGNGPPLAIPAPLKGTKIVWQRATVSVGAPSINVLVSGQAASQGTNPAGAYVNGGNLFGAAASAGPLDANPFQVGGLGVSTTTTVTSLTGTSVTTAGTGGIGIGTPAPGTSQTRVTSTLAAGLVAVYSGAGGTAALDTGAGGMISIGQTVTTGAAKTINIGTDATAAIATNVGNTNIGSLTSLASGNGGLRLGSAVLFTAPVAVADGTGSLGSAATTVDITSRLVVTQTTPVITQAAMRLLQPPTVTTAGRRCVVQSSTASTASFTVGDATLKQGVNLNPGQACEFLWDGAAWGPLACTQQDPVQGAALTDAAAASARAGQVTQYTLPAATISAPHTNTLSATGAIKGDVMIITRLDVTANAYTFAGAQNFVMVASKINFAQFRFDGAAWQFVSGGMN